MKNDNLKNQYRVNGQIHAREVRVVGDGGTEVVPTRRALDMARQQGLDLVEISPNAEPPVCRIIDYSKFIYQQKKRQKEMKQKQVKVEVKEIRFGPQTDDHDYQFKAQACPRVPSGRQQGTCLCVLPRSFHTLQGARRGAVAAFRQ